MDAKYCYCNGYQDTAGYHNAADCAFARAVDIKTTDAASEIAALRAERDELKAEGDLLARAIEGLQEAHGKALCDQDTLKAEVERLRAALREIAECGTIDKLPNGKFWTGDRFDYAIRIARAALEQKEGV